MEFKIPVDELQSVFTRLSNVVQPNDDGVKSLVLIEVGDEDVKFKATDGSVTIIITSDQCEIIRKGKNLVKLADLKGYISKFIPLVDDYGTKDFHIIVDGPEGIIKTKTYFQESKAAYRRLRFELFNQWLSNYPTVKPFGEAQLIINSSILKRGINKVMHCINPAEIRRAMTGVHIIVKEDGIVFAGTNGVKLEEVELDINADIEKASYIFKYNLASVLRAILDDDAQVFMKLEGTHAYFKSNDMYIVGSLIINESYPDYKPLFNLDKTIVVPRGDFADTVHTVMDVLDPEDNSRLTLNFSGTKMILKNDIVESVQDLSEPLEYALDIDVNGDFLDSLLHDFMGDKIEIHFTKGNNYIVFKSPDNEKQTALLTIVKRR